MLIIKIPFTKEQLETNIKFVHQCVREASLPAQSHEAATAILNDILAGIVAEPDKSTEKPEETPTQEPQALQQPKLINVIKTQARQKAKKRHR